MNLRIIAPPVFFFLLNNFVIAQKVYSTKSGEIHFLSKAPLEMIEANSKTLSGAIDGNHRTFAFAVPITSFQGFNSGLQREHFNENYMESDKYPAATFKGKIIEEIDFGANGTYTVRAKGMLNIHGVEVERIIKSTLSVINGKISIKSEFEVPLAEHKIKIPKIVNQKIAEKIFVKVNAELNTK